MGLAGGGKGGFVGILLPTHKRPSSLVRCLDLLWAIGVLALDL